MRPSISSSPRTRTGFGRLGRTCSILSSRRGHTGCSHCNATSNPNNSNCISVGSVFNNVNVSSLFSSFFNNNTNNNTQGHHRHHHNHSVTVSLSIALRRTTLKYGGAVDCSHLTPYRSYGNANETRNTRRGRYDHYRNANCIAAIRHSFLNRIRSSSPYPSYRNRNAIVSRPYRAYSNRNHAPSRRGVSVSVPTNISANHRLHIDNFNRTNLHNRPSNSLVIGIHITSRRHFGHGNSSLCLIDSVSVTRTTLNYRVRIRNVVPSRIIGIAIPTNTRCNSAIDIGGCNVPHVNNNNSHNHLVIRLHIIIPAGLSGGRHRLLHTFTSRVNSSITSNGGSIASHVGDTLSSVLSWKTHILTPRVSIIGLNYHIGQIRSSHVATSLVHLNFTVIRPRSTSLVIVGAYTIANRTRTGAHGTIHRTLTRPGRPCIIIAKYIIGLRPRRLLRLSSHIVTRPSGVSITRHIYRILNIRSSDIPTYDSNRIISTLNHSHLNIGVRSNYGRHYACYVI